VIDLVARGQIKPRIAHRLPIEQAAEAHSLLAQGSAAGRVVLTHH
jgi:NADPH:quinone reductase-like Zn-dependent oxidoreductase